MAETCGEETRRASPLVRKHCLLNREPRPRLTLSSTRVIGRAPPAKDGVARNADHRKSCLFYNRNFCGSSYTRDTGLSGEPTTCPFSAGKNGMSATALLKTRRQ